ETQLEKKSRFLVAARARARSSEKRASRADKSCAKLNNIKVELAALRAEMDHVSRCLPRARAFCTVAPRMR
ncbi:hypothetical protein, partial [Klebsiella pneumoniae]|uniref:hypothetical protein n=1 Tax=Klebsiella pneumoniae TaxID=573 RepID=UPI0025A1AF90